MGVEYACNGRIGFDPPIPIAGLDPGIYESLSDDFTTVGGSLFSLLFEGDNLAGITVTDADYGWAKSPTWDRAFTLLQQIATTHARTLVPDMTWEDDGPGDSGSVTVDADGDIDWAPRISPGPTPAAAPAADTPLPLPLSDIGGDALLARAMRAAIATGTAQIRLYPDAFKVTAKGVLLLRIAGAYSRADLAHILAIPESAIRPS